MSQGETLEEALANLEDAKESWIEVELEDGHPIPEPREDEEFSGKLLVRMPRFLHKKLTLQADRENISLNQYVVSCLSEAIGAKQSSRQLESFIENVASTLNSLVLSRNSRNAIVHLGVTATPAHYSASWVKGSGTQALKTIRARLESEQMAIVMGPSLTQKDSNPEVDDSVVLAAFGGWDEKPKVRAVLKVEMGHTS